MEQLEQESHLREWKALSLSRMQTYPKWKTNFANFKDDEWRPTRSDESVLSNFIECIAGVRKAFPKLSNVVVVVY